MMYPTVGRSFHNFASISEILSRSPKLTLQSVLLKHDKQPCECDLLTSLCPPGAKPQEL